MRIDSEITDIIVEIEDKEYTLAPYTVRTVEQLGAVDANKGNKYKHVYEQQLEKLRILLGKDAVKELFKDGKDENITRIRVIYTGVINAFEEPTIMSSVDAMRDSAKPIIEVADKLKPLADMFAALQGKQSKYPTI